MKKILLLSFLLCSIKSFSQEIQCEMMNLPDAKVGQIYYYVLPENQSYPSFNVSLDIDLQAMVNPYGLGLYFNVTNSTSALTGIPKKAGIYHVDVVMDYSKPSECTTIICRK